MNLPALTLKMAVLETRAWELEQRIKEVRMLAEGQYAEHRKAGFSNVKPTLPNGIEAGTVSINAGTTEVVFTEKVLLDWVRQTDPANVEDYVSPDALTDKRLIDLVREHLPELVAKRVNPKRREEIRSDIADRKNGTYVAEGEVFKVADVYPHDPTGRFSYRPSKKDRQVILAAIADGTVTEDGEVPGGTEDEAPEQPAAPGHAPSAPAGLGPFGDEDGFYTPESAAAHAVDVQGGFSTPPIEAFRMIRDGGIAAERAVAWLSFHGLDPDDPREGRDTPWPLPAAGGAADAG
jgi:hypothetical protein